MIRTRSKIMDHQLQFFENKPTELPQDERARELSELIARYRVIMNELVGRMIYLEHNSGAHSIPRRRWSAALLIRFSNHVVRYPTIQRNGMVGSVIPPTRRILVYAKCT